MLFSGNTNVQTGIEINARETREETLFLNLKRMLEIASRNYKDMLVTTIVDFSNYYNYYYKYNF